MNHYLNSPVSFADGDGHGAPFWLMTLVFGLVVWCCPFGSAAQNIDRTRFDQLFNELYRVDEPWQTIPWMTNLADAQRKAATVGKPIFIWAMDGHPLGCT